MKEAVEVGTEGLATRAVNGFDARLKAYIDPIFKRREQIFEEVAHKQVSIHGIKRAMQREIARLKRLETSDLKTEAIANLQRNLKKLSSITDDVVKTKATTPVQQLTGAGRATKEVVRKGKKIGLRELDEIKRDLQRNARKFYNQSDQIGQADLAGKAYSKVATAANEIIESVAPKEFLKLNHRIRRMLRLRDKLKNFGLKSGKAEIDDVIDLAEFGGEGVLDMPNAIKLLDGLYNKGGIKYRRLVKTLDRTLGTNLDELAQLNKYAKEFATKDGLSAFATGRSVLPLIAGGAVGAAQGDTQKGATYGLLLAAMGSPAARSSLIKAGVIANRLGGAGAQGLARALSSTPVMATLYKGGGGQFVKDRFK
jgi:hypothetical protein